ncbi:hypothetical protein [Thermococcus sp.]|uniref:hypothetical protein n=1 Tax=Thermococcus sp. TaxID=35749 RepID=UPI00262E4C34|nr:hypothetical protein [Thermococcus sp.]
MVVKVYKRYEALVESEAGILEGIGLGKIELTLFDDNARMRLPVGELELTYTGENGETILELLRILRERMELEAEADKLRREV